MPRVIILGSGTPTPSPIRWGSSFMVEIGGEWLMFDCGPATTYKLYKFGLTATQVDRLFFTHHHSDHDADYPTFLLTRFDMSIGNENELLVYGPRLTEQLTERLIGEDIGAFWHDIVARTNHPLSLFAHQERGGSIPRKPPAVVPRDISPGTIATGKNWEITADRVEHVQPYLDSLAYRIDSNEGSIVFTGDTEPCEDVVQLAKDADVMFCMCWDDEETMIENKESHGVCGTLGAANMAQEAGVKKLVLTHLGPNLARHPIMEKGIGDVKNRYDGELIFSDELLSVDV